MPTIELADKMTAIADELRKLPATLPELRAALFHSDGSVNLVPKTNWRPWQEVRQAIAYAEHFGVDLDIILSYSGRGRAVASFTLAGNVVTVDGDVNSAHAYELGRVLGRPLDAIESVTVTPARLREVIEELAPAATS